ncbi:MAG TPA: methyltransferase [Galbitalea sp.]|jgi:hypothetical protein
MSDTTLVRQTWVAFGPAGALGSIHAVDTGYTFRLMDDSASRGIYPSLAVAKSALHAALEPGSEWPEFKEH